MEQQGHGTGEKMSLMQKIKKKLHVGHAHGADQHTDVDDGQQGHAVVAAPVTEGHAVTGTDGTPVNSATYGQQAHSRVTGEKKDVMEDNKEKLPGGHDGDHEQTSGTDVHRGHVGTATHGTPATDDAYGQQGHTGVTGMGMHGTGDKNGVMENIKDKLPGGHGEHQQTGAHYGQQGHAVVAAPVTEGHAVTGTHGTPANSATYGQQAHSGVTGEKKDVMEDNKEKLPGGRDGDHEQTSGTDGCRGHVGTATHGTPATDDAYGQQGHTGVAGMGTHVTGEKDGVMENIKDKIPGGHGDQQQTGGHYGQQGHADTAAHDTPAISGTYRQQGKSGVIGTGTHGAAEKNGEKKDVMEDNKEKLPSGHDGDHEQTSGTDGHRGHVGTATHGTPAIDDAYGQQGHTEVTGMGTHGTGEKNGVMENIKDKLPGGHGDHQQTGGHYGQDGHAGTAAHGTMDTDDTYGQQGHSVLTGTGKHGTDETKGVMEKLPGGHGDHKQTGSTYGKEGCVGTATHGIPATDDAYGQQGHTTVTGTDTDDTGEKKGVIGNVVEKLPGGHSDHQKTGGTYGQQGHTRVTGTGTHGTGEKNGVMENAKEKLPGDHGDHQQTKGSNGQQGHTGVTGMGTDGTGEKKGVMENVTQKLPGGHGNNQQTSGTYGQQGHTNTATHDTGGSYGQQGQPGVTGMGTHGTGEKNGVMENIKEKLPVDIVAPWTPTHGTVDTDDTYGQQGHSGLTGTGTHGTDKTKGLMEKLPGGHGDHQTGSTYGQEGHTGATGAVTHGAGEKKGAMEDIKEKLPGGQEHTTGTTGTVTHDSPATDEKQGHAETTGSGAHDGTGETKSYMEMIKDTLYGTY